MQFSYHFLFGTKKFRVKTLCISDDRKIQVPAEWNLISKSLWMRKRQVGFHAIHKLFASDRHNLICRKLSLTNPITYLRVTDSGDFEDSGTG